MKTIFVSIAAYRDADVQNTINSLFENAAWPDRVYVGVFLQIDPNADSDCLVKSAPNVTVKTIHAKDAKGAGYARHMCQRMMDGEDYFLQVDSHMRFAKNWDSLLIQMHADTQRQKSVISTYPLPFTPPNTLNAPRHVIINPKKFDVDGVLLQSSGMYELKDDQELIRNPFISAGLLFGPSQFIKDVPADPHIMFTGEEITTGIRLWTHGYNVYVPNKVVAYHNYATNPARPRIWTSITDDSKLSLNSRQRVLYICRQKAFVTDDCLFNIDKYGLGMQRSFESYEEFAQLDFKNRLYKGKELVV